MTAPGGGLDASGIRASLVEYQRSQDPQRLGEAAAAVERLVTRPGFGDLDGAARGLVWTLGAAALTWRARTARAAPDDLDRAIEWSGNAVNAWPADDPNLARARSNLATALTDRYERDGEPGDLDRALTLFADALTDMRTSGDRLDVILHSYGCCFHEHATAPGGVADFDRAIALFEEALRQPDPDAEERAGYLNSLGLTLRRKGLALADPMVLALSSHAYVEARRGATRGSETYVAASINLAGVLYDRAEADNEVDLLRQAVDIYREVLGLLSPSDERRQVLVTTNLATALIDLYRYSRDRSLLDQATRDLRANVERLSEGPVRHTVLANLPAALHEMFDYTGRLALLDEAVAVQELLVGSPSAARPERMLNLGVSLLARFRRRRSVEDLDRAIALFAETARTTASAVERASALNSHANALSVRFDDSQALADIEACIALRADAVGTVAAGSMEHALYLANLGVDLLKRYELTGDRDDLRRAIDGQRQALRAAEGRWSDQPRFLAGLADSLAREAERTNRPDDVAEARDTYRRALELARVSLPEQALAAAMRWGGWESRRRAWAEAGEAYDLGLAALRKLVADQDLRGDKESWLMDAQGLPAAATFASVRAGLLRRAVTVLEDGRAMLLAEALARRARLRSVRPLDQPVASLPDVCEGSPVVDVGIAELVRGVETQPAEDLGGVSRLPGAASAAPGPRAGRATELRRVRRGPAQRRRRGRRLLLIEGAYLLYLSVHMEPAEALVRRRPPAKSAVAPQALNFLLANAMGQLYMAAVTALERFIATQDQKHLDAAVQVWRELLAHDAPAVVPADARLAIFRKGRADVLARLRRRR